MIKMADLPFLFAFFFRTNLCSNSSDFDKVNSSFKQLPVLMFNNRKYSLS